MNIQGIMNKFVMYGLVIVAVAVGTTCFVFGDAIIELIIVTYYPSCHGSAMMVHDSIVIFIHS